MFDVIFGVAYLAIFAAVAVAELLFANRLAASTDKRFVVNFGLGFLNLAMIAALPVGLVATASYAQAYRLGLFNYVEMPGWAVFIASLICLSLVQYFAHRLFHAAPLLWRVHRVHHCDRRMDASTTLRTHPLEHVVMLLLTCPVVLALGSPVWVVYAVALISFAGATFSHGNLRIAPAWSKRMARLLTTPDFHIVHHSTARSECDSNYGDVFTLWDRLFGSYRELQVARVGLGDAADAQADNLIRQLRGPFVREMGTAAVAGKS